MARRGSFGRLPTAAPSLTNVIVSLGREFQQQRDRNIVDAWKNGGLFEGKPVTDDILLAHWAKRLEGINPKDPLYDTYKNAYLQTDYSIHESRQSTLYAQGKIGDGAMAKFYLDWAKKFPVDSEFYRILQRDAAQFMKSAAAKGAASSRRAKEDAFDKAMKNEEDTNQAAGNYLLNVLNTLARTNALVAPNGTIAQFDPTDPAKILQLLSYITPLRGQGTGEEYNVAGTKVLYHDRDGRPVTGADILANLRAMDPSASVVDMAYLKAKLDQQRASIKTQIAMATTTGHASMVEQLTKNLDSITAAGLAITAWPVAQVYGDYRDDYERVRNDPAATPQEKIDAWNRYSERLTKLADDPSIAANDNFRTRILNEANLVDGAPTVRESLSGMGSSIEPSDTSDISRNRNFLSDLASSIAVVADPSNNMSWTQGKYTEGRDGNLSFVPVPGGPSVGFASNEDIAKLSPTGTVRTIMLPSANGATVTPIAVVGMPITVSARDETGKSITIAEGSKTIGEAFSVNIGGRTVDIFGYTVNGQFVYSQVPPWDPDDVRAVKGANGWNVDVSGLVPSDPQTTGLTGGAVTGSPGFGIEGKRIPKGALAGDPGNLVITDPAAIIFTRDPHQAAGVDPFTDSMSLSVAAVLQLPDGQERLKALMQNKDFYDQVVYETRILSGFRVDPATGTWAGGNESMYQTMMTNVGRKAQTAQTFIDNGFMSTWDKGPVTGPDGKPLATPADQTAGSEYDLAGLYNPGTGTFSPPPLTLGDHAAIRFGKDLTVPRPPARVSMPEDVGRDVYEPFMPAPITPTPVTPIPAPTPIAPTPAPAPVSKPTYQPTAPAYEPGFGGTATEEEGSYTYTPGGRLGF